MTITVWISLTALVLVYGTAIIGFWIKINVKLKELDMKIDSNKKEYVIFRARSIEERDRLDNKFNEMVDHNRIEHKDLSVKLDNILASLNKFMIYVEKEK